MNIHYEHWYYWYNFLEDRRINDTYEETYYIYYWWL